MGFDEQYELLELDRDDGVKTFHAREIATDRPVKAHLFSNPKAPFQAVLLKQLAALPPEQSARIIARGTHLGSVYIITDKLADHPGLLEWITSSTKPADKKSARNQPEPATLIMRPEDIEAMHAAAKAALPNRTSASEPTPSPQSSPAEPNSSSPSSDRKPQPESVKPKAESVKPQPESVKTDTGSLEAALSHSRINKEFLDLFAAEEPSTHTTPAGHKDGLAPFPSTSQTATPELPLVSHRLAEAKPLRKQGNRGLLVWILEFFVLAAIILLFFAFLRH